MTETGNLRKLFFAAATIFETALCLSAYLLNYFTHKRMGMARHIVYLSHKLAEGYPLPIMAYTFVVLIGVLTALNIIAVLMKYKGLSKLVIASTGVTLVITFAYLMYMVTNTISEQRAYYFLCIVLGLVVFVQNIKNIYLIRSVL